MHYRMRYSLDFDPKIRSGQVWHKEYYLEPSLFNIFKNIDYKGHFLKNDFGSKFSNLGMCGNSNDRKFVVSN